MFSKEEAASLRKRFWVSFGKSFPRKWLLYRTKIKGFEFKFDAGRKHLRVALDINSGNSAKDELLYEQMLSLRKLMESEIPDVFFDERYRLESGIDIFRIYCDYPSKFSIYNPDTWADAYQFMLDRMNRFELFFYEYEDHIRAADL
ncbi:MAG: DUF4268 domain-containing protein [Flavobacteriaceae bacterium]